MTPQLTLDDAILAHLGLSPDALRRAAHYAEFYGARQKPLGADRLVREAQVDQEALLGAAERLEQALQEGEL